MNFPCAVAVDSSGTLFVGDGQNNRLILFENAASLGFGAAATGVIGKPEFTTGGSTLTRSGTGRVDDVAFGENGEFWIAGSGRALRFVYDSFQPDNRIGTKSGNQRGNNLYNLTGAGQTASIKMKGNRSGKGFFTLQNDGDVPDSFLVRATKGNRKLKIVYKQSPGGNVTAAITGAGLTLNDLDPAATAGFIAIIKGTRSSRGKRASRKLTIPSTSLTDGETDTAKAKIKKKP
jgi:hypothetical protein